MERNVYLKKTEWKKALHAFTNRFTSCFPLDSETVPVRDSLHRVTACMVSSLIPSPAFNSAAMDGIAVNAEITFEASPSDPKRLIVGTNCDFIDTGNPLKDTYNAVIKIEDVVTIDAKTVEVKYAVPPGKDVRFKGEDFIAGGFIVGESHLIRPVDIGAMLSCGVFGVDVRRKPHVAIIPTGSEIVEPGRTIRPGAPVLEYGKIFDCNSYIAANMITEWGGVPERFPIVKNDMRAIEKALLQAISHNDIVITIAGSSAGSEDYTPKVIKKVGTVYIHGVDLMPGKPVILSSINKTPVIGLPGYPVSAYVILDIFVRETVAMALGIAAQKRRSVKAILEQDIASRLGMDEIVRVKLARKDDVWYAMPLKRGAGILSSLVSADGLLHIPRDEEGVNKGNEVEVELLKRVPMTNDQ